MSIFYLKVIYIGMYLPESAENADVSVPILEQNQSIYRKVAPGRLFTFKFLLFSIDIKNCNPSQWRHSIVWFTQ
jgi:hypothetical protein